VSLPVKARSAVVGLAVPEALCATSGAVDVALAVVGAATVAAGALDAGISVGGAAGT
jgi:hypothetical protein